MKEGFVVPLKEKIAFGLGDFGLNVVLTAVSFYLLYFAINVAGIPAKWAGGIFLGVNIYNALLNFLVGMWSDRVHTRLGRRRPFVLWGCFPLALCFILLWIIPSSRTALNMVYFGAVYCMYCTAYILVAVPYNSLMPELSQDYDERTSISGIRMGLSFVGNLLGAAGVALIVDVWFKGRTFYKESYPVMGAIMGAILLASLLITFFGTKERVRSATEVTGGIVSIVTSIMSLREFRIALAMFITNMMGFIYIQNLLLFYLKDVLRMPENLTFVLLGLPLIMAVAAAPLWVYVGEKRGKKTAYIIAASFMVVVMAFALVLPARNVILACLMCALAGVGISATQIIPFSIMPDVIEYDELLHGVRREGTFYGVALSLMTILSGVVIWLSMTLMGWCGYVENSTLPQPDSALTCIRVMTGVGAGIFFIISAVFVQRLPITKESHAEIRRQLAEKK